MPLTLPTDTTHLRFETRQYELFNRPLGQGIARRKIGIATAAGVVWVLVMLIFGVNPLTRFGPTLYLVPPFLFVYFGTRTDESGRMNLLVWYDALLARLPGRRRVLGNPLMQLGEYTPEVVTFAVETELHPRKIGEPLTPLASRARKGETGT